MKRKVLLIIGKSDILIPGEYSFREENIVKSLRNRSDIDLEIVGSYDAEAFDFNSLNSAIDNLNPDQSTTVIILSHGTYSYKDGFSFILDFDNKLSSESLFMMIDEKMQDTPVDVFTTACHGGAILYDKEILPVGSTLVGLTDAKESNSGIDFDKMQEMFGSFHSDITAYNLLQFYLMNCLKNRFHPHIGISGGNEYDLDAYLKEYISKPINTDYSYIDNPEIAERLKTVSEKITASKSEWGIYAQDYGVALAIVLNDIASQGCFDIERGNKRL